MKIDFDKSRVRILVVDDDQAIREMLCVALKDDGWQVDSAENGKVAQEKFSSSEFHIVLSDINMPEITGIELLEFVKQERPHTEFVIMTSHATLDTAVKAISLGAYDYLNKPFDDISVVSRKMSQVAERILLRQQNSELLKRLKLAGKDLKRLLQVSLPLGGIIELEKLKVQALDGFKELFADDTCRAAWFDKTAGAEWQCAQEVPEAGLFEGINEPQEALSKFTDYRDLDLHYFKFKEEEKAAVVFESLKPSLSKMYLQQMDLCFTKACSHEEIASLANRDGLTRLYNHRYFQERLRQEFSQARRQKNAVSLILCDVDHFKHYNDTNGHPAGDALLKELAQLLNYHQSRDQDVEVEAPTADFQDKPSMKRVTDIVARYGGEEFVMILPFTPYDGAKIKAERIRRAVAEHSFENGESQPLGRISLSIGVATYPDQASDPKELIEMADKALYMAKKRGRNMVVGYTEVSNDQPSQEAPQDEPQAETKEGEEDRPTLANLLEEDATQELEVLSDEGSDAAELVPESTGVAEEVKKEISEEVDVGSLVSAIESAVDEAESKSESKDVPGLSLDAFANETSSDSDENIKDAEGGAVKT